MEVAHLIIQAMLISLAVLQIVVSLLLESHYVPAKNRKKRSNTHTKLHNCMLSFIYILP